MKAMYTLLAVAVVGLVGCKDDNKGLLDPNAKVYINGKSSLKAIAGKADATAEEEQPLLTPLEVVQKAERMESTIIIVGIGDQNRDLEKARIIGPSTWVVGSQGQLGVELLESRNIILVTRKPGVMETADTIAYVSNALMQAAEVAIKAAYATQDYATCYRLFEEAFVFVPTTGAEYKALKEQGRN